MAALGAVLLLGQQARADACADARVRVEGELDSRWLVPIVEMCDWLPSLRDLDPSASLRVVPSGADVVLEVRLADGRSALRRLASPVDLRTTVEALLTVPPEKAAPREVPSPSTTPEPAGARDRVEHEPAPHRPETRPPAVAFEWSATASGRLAGTPAYASVGPTAHGALSAGAWSLVLSARWEAYQRPLRATDRSFEMETVAAGFGVARRMDLTGGLRLDLGPQLILVDEAQSLESTEGEQSGSVADVRTGLGARAWIGRSVPRFVVQLDGEISPTRLRREIRIDAALPPLPAWSIGLGLGVGWPSP